MATFAYKALSRDGAEAKGTIEAASRAIAVRQLAQDGLIVYDIVEGASRPKEAWYNRQLFVSRQLDDGGLAEFSRNLAAMLRQKISLEQALVILQDATASPRLGSALKIVVAALRSGEASSSAFDRASGFFSKEFLAVVRAGSAANSLADALDLGADQFNRRRLQRQGLIAATAYPAFLIVAAFIVFLVVLRTLIPTLFETLQSSGREVTGSIATLNSISEFVGQSWHWLIAASLVLGAVVLLGRKRLKHGLGVVFPAIARQANERAFGDLARRLNMLLESGATLDDALAEVIEPSAAAPFLSAVERARELIRGGETASEAFRRDKASPPVFTQLFELGERTNNLPGLLTVAAQSLEASADQRIRKFTGLLTPVLTLVVGALIALLVSVLMTAVLEVSKVAV